MRVGTKLAVYDSGQRFVGVLVHIHTEKNGKPMFLVQLTNQDMFWYHPKQCKKLKTEISYKSQEKRVA